ncbi:hemagglutinin repeat-containing protein [Pseudomonas massiliensis]|uniref:hemagglutinin repeat-containing protein n=1 Tax=Pseudomonas massiliensis TaxID=522492 RepID=UPI00058DB0D8|nr:hemagglutinin repeat-containing protein [Pseudomonas massiliensis]
MKNKTKGSPVLFLRPDPLRWAVAGALLFPVTGIAMEGLVPLPGPGGTAQVSQQNGVPVVAITAPNPQGLSHNPFDTYNVPLQGLVLNNALVAGQSQLAGALGANPQFQGQAASVILNEVVGQLPSNIQGPQEIFGQAADYVLANPNGIHVHGVGFINTPRAVFLVGTPEIENGRLAGLNTFNAAGDLRISGRGLNTAAAVDLIAPRIDSQGRLEVGPSLTAIAGRNRVQADTLQVLESRQRPEEAPGIDLNVLGAMKAGRIRMVSTREGAGIRLAGPQVIGSAGVTVASAGDLKVGPDGKGTTTIAATQGDLDLSAGRDVEIIGSRLAGRTLAVKAKRDLTLDATTEQNVRNQREAWSRKALFITTETYRKHTEERSDSLQGNTLTASADMNLSAGRNVKVRASDLRAEGALKVSAADNVNIEAGVSSRSRSQEIRHRKHLWRGNLDEYRLEEQAVASRLQGGSLSIEAGRKAVVRGSDLVSQGDLDITAGSIEIDSQGLRHEANKDNYRGDLVKGFFFADKGDRQETGLRQRGSDLKAQGVARLVSDDVLIRGSKVEGKAGTLTVGEKGPVIIDSAAEFTHIKDNRSDTKLGGVFGKSSSLERQHTETVGSTVRTDGDHRSLSASDIRVVGSSIETAGTLRLEAKDKVEILAAKDTLTETTRAAEGKLYAHAGETRAAEDGKPGSKQWSAGVGYQRETTGQQVDTLKHKGSSVTGAKVITAADQVTVHGSKVESTQGNNEVLARQLEVKTLLDETRSNRTTTTIKAGEQVTGGMDRVGSGHTFERNRDEERRERATAALATIQSAGDIRFDVREHASYEGAVIDAKGQVIEKAQTIDRKVVTEIDDVQHKRSSLKVDTGVSAEWKDLTRPIEKLVNGQEQSRLQKQGVEDALVPPSLGLDVMASHMNREQGTRTETPVVTQVSATGLDAEVQGRLYDQGSAYRIAGGQSQIKAGSHEAPAAVSRQIETLKRLDVNAAARLDTVTSSDINVKLSADGSSRQTLLDTQTAVPMQLTSPGGIRVQLGTDGRYEGSQFEGKPDIRAGGDVKMLQAQNRVHKEESETSGYGLLKGGTAPTGENALFMGALNHKVLASTDTTGVGVGIEAPEGSIQAGGDAELQGVTINNGRAATERFSVEAAGVASITAKLDTHEAQGQSLGGALQAGFSRNPSADAQRLGGSLGGHVDMGRVSEQAERRIGADLAVKDLTVTGGAHKAVAVHLEGTQLAGDRLELNAPAGGVLIEAARGTEEKDNLQVALGGEAGVSRGLDKDGDASALYARAKVDVDKVDSTTYKNADLQVKSLEVSMAKDLELKGATVNAQHVKGNVDGDLRITSVQDQVSSTQVKVDGRFSKEKNPQGLLNALGAMTGPLAGKAKEKVGEQVQALDQTLAPSLLIDVVTEQRDNVNRMASLNGQQGIDLNVAGDTTLTGAKLRSGSGQVNLGGSEVRLDDLHTQDYRADVSLNAAASPAELISSIVEELTAKRSDQAKADEHGNLGVIRTGGHDRSQTLKAAVEDRR